MGSYRLVKMLNPISITVNGTFTPKGAYNGGTSYSVGDQVDYNGTSYILYSAASAGTLPTDNTKWGVLASKGDKGDKGDTGATGLKGDKGDTGLTGAAGTNGQGVPTGGTTGQQLAKINGTDYNTQWVNPVDISGKADTSALTAHTSNTSNPHSVTKAQVGLGSVPDTDFTSAIAAKQDTLVSGTNIKTINSTSILGSGDIVVAAGSDPLKEDVANKSTTTTLGTSDTLYPSQKAVKTYVDTTTGAYVSKAGDTMTGTLNTQTLLPTANLTYNLGGTSNYNLNTYTQKLYLNSTAYLDGSTAGQIQATGILTADNIKRGTGFPNGVVTANVGTVYIDTAITNGASSWVKKSGTGNTGWVVLEGDTGWRDVTSIFTNFEVVNPNDKGIRWRREGSTNYIEGSCQIKSLSTSVIIIDTAMASRSDAVVIRFEGQGTTTEVIDLKTLGTAMYPVPSAAASVGRRGYFNTSYGASQSQAITWPSTLPGTAI